MRLMAKNKQVDGQIWQFNLDRTERVEYIDTMILHLSNTLTAFHKSYMYVRSLNALDAWDLIQGQIDKPAHNNENT